MKIIGINDEVTACECCGRRGLKKTVILSNGDGEVRYGKDCAAAALRRSALRVAAEAESAEVERKRPVRYWLVKIVTEKPTLSTLWVVSGRDEQPAQFATAADAEKCVSDMSANGTRGVVIPVK